MYLLEKVSTYFPFVIGECNAQIGHGSQYGYQRLYRVRVYYGPVLLEILGSESALVNYSETQQEQISRRVFILNAFELLLQYIRVCVVTVLDLSVTVQVTATKDPLMLRKCLNINLQNQV